MTACVHHTNVRLTQSAAGQPSPRAGGAIRGRTILKFEPSKITRLILLSVGVLDSQIISVGKTQTQIWVVQNEAQSYCGFFVLGPYIWYNKCKEPKLWVWSAVPWDPQFQRMASDYPSMDYLGANFCLFPFSSLSSPWLLHSQFPEPCSVSHDLSQLQATAKASAISVADRTFLCIPLQHHHPNHMILPPLSRWIPPKKQICQESCCKLCLALSFLGNLVKK